MTGPRPGPLFGGRARKAPSALEFATHCALADLLRFAITPGWLFWHTPNGENRDATTGARLKRMGTRPGVSDFLFLAPPAGRLHALEIKRKGEKPTETQSYFLGDVRACGGVAEWVDSYEAAVAVLKRWGAVRGATL